MLRLCFSSKCWILFYVIYDDRVVSFFFWLSMIKYRLFFVTKNVSNLVKYGDVTPFIIDNYIYTYFACLSKSKPQNVYSVLLVTTAMMTGFEVTECLPEYVEQKEYLYFCYLTQRWQLPIFLIRFITLTINLNYCSDSYLININCKP